MEDALSRRQLRYFTVLAEELHFVRAAERLGIPQPALSQQVRRLEELIGCTLVRRKPRVELTEAGQTFLVGAKRVLDDLGATLDRTRSAARGETGCLFVGAVSSTLLIPAITRTFRAFAARFPLVQLEVKAMETADQLDALRKGRLDVAIARDPPDEPWLASLPLIRERLMVALPAGHRLSGTRRLPLGELASEPFILFDRGVNPGIHERILGVCRKAGFEPQVEQEVDDVYARLGIVAAGIGWTIVAASAAAAKRPEVVFRPISGTAASTLVAICNAAGRPLSAPANLFVRIANEQATPPARQGPSN